MPLNIISSYAKRYRVSKKKVEKLWNRAKEMGLEKFIESSPSFYPYVVGILNNMLGEEAEANSAEPNRDLVESTNFLCEAILMEKVENLPDNYPKFDLPADTKTLQMLYDMFNKKYFSGSLPKCRLKFAPLAKSYYGKAHVKWGDGFKIKDLLITIAGSIKNDRKNLVDTMLHEQIHIHQYMMNSKTKSHKYSEVTWAEIFANSKDKHTWGHNGYFHDWMNKLNSKGFGITVVADGPVDVDLVGEFYGIAFFNSSDTGVLLYTPEDPKKHMTEITDEVISRVGDGFFERYVIFKTKDANIMSGTRITKSWKLPKNVINIRFKAKQVQGIVDSKLSSVVSKSNVVGASSKADVVSNQLIPKEIIDTVAGMMKHRHAGFEPFFSSTIYNAFSEMSRMKPSDLDMRKMYDVRVPARINNESVEYIRKNWMAINDIELKKSSAFKSVLSGVKWAILTEKEVTAQDIKNYKYNYDSSYKDRVDIKKYRDLLYDLVAHKLSLETKKRGTELSKDQIKDILKEKIFKDTFLK